MEYDKSKYKSKSIGDLRGNKGMDSPYMAAAKSFGEYKGSIFDADIHVLEGANRASMIEDDNRRKQQLFELAAEGLILADYIQSEKKEDKDIENTSAKMSEYYKAEAGFEYKEGKEPLRRDKVTLWDAIRGKGKWSDIGTNQWTYLDPEGKEIVSFGKADMLALTDKINEQKYDKMLDLPFFGGTTGDLAGYGTIDKAMEYARKQGMKTFMFNGMKHHVPPLPKEDK